MSFDPILWTKIKALEADVANLVNGVLPEGYYRAGEGITISSDNEISVSEDLRSSITALQATIENLTPAESEKTPEQILTDALTDATTAKTTAEEAKTLAEETAVWDTF